jgi:hypothetical protein
VLVYTWFNSDDHPISTSSIFKIVLIAGQLENGDNILF